MVHHVCPSTLLAATDTVDAVDGYILHKVSKLDTLAGVAIKYGVEVADLKRLNGLATDLQMFAHKSLRIPVERRHPSYPPINNARNASLSMCTQPTNKNSIFHLPFGVGINHDKRRVEKRLSSLALSSLRGYYGLSPQDVNFSDTGMTEVPLNILEVDTCLDKRTISAETTTPLDPRDGYQKAGDKVCGKLNGRQIVGRTHQEMNGQVRQRTVQIPCADDSNNEGLVRRCFKPETPGPPCEICYDIDVEQNPSIFDKMLQLFGRLGGKENVAGLPITILKALDGAFPGWKDENTLLKVRESSSLSSLQVQNKIQIPKVFNHQFKTALD
ncbi:hypothetical protein KP509_22G050100 [Ceratopteris richardii]|uniref:LysM domain-containing protein n=1 Tax=Ceratopteris richardii TaxID=49495 RepID=A0A8T2S5Z7_CERRI|nr:hypothetical protein KP509_22G050100 [Ceratopteris richardii]